MQPTHRALKIRIVVPAELTQQQLAAWNRWRRTDAALLSPYFHPEFTLAVAAVRNDVEVAVLEDEQGLAGFFPFQRSRLNFGRPVGGRLCDLHGVVTRPGVDWSAGTLIQECGLAGWDFTDVPTTQTPFAPHGRAVEPSGYLDLSRGFEAYVKERRQSGSRTIPQQQRKRRKMEREIGPLCFVRHVDDPHLLHTVMQWKSNQYRRTGFHDVFSNGWTVELLKRLHATQTESFRGVLSALYAGDHLVAAHFGMQTDDVLHYWFPTYDPQFHRYSPGRSLLLELARDLDQTGITRIDLGKGRETFKASLESAAFDVAAGSVVGNRVVGGVRRCWSQTRNWLKRSRWGAPARLSARLVRPVREWLSFR